MPLGTGACLPCRSAYVAELCLASTSHMIAAMVELDHLLASRTSCPALCPSQCKHLAVLVVQLTNMLRVHNFAFAPRASARATSLRGAFEGRLEPMPKGALDLFSEKMAACGVRAVHALQGAEFRGFCFK